MLHMAVRNRKYKPALATNLRKASTIKSFGPLVRHISTSEWEISRIQRKCFPSPLFSFGSCFCWKRWDSKEIIKRLFNSLNCCKNHNFTSFLNNEVKLWSHNFPSLSSDFLWTSKRLSWSKIKVQSAIPHTRPPSCSLHLYTHPHTTHTHTHTETISSLQQHCRQRMAPQLVIKAGYWSQDAEGRLHLLYHTAASPVSWMWLLLQVVIPPDFTIIYLCQTGTAHSCELGESLLPALPPLRCRISR